jgi:hypothetical protein
VPDAKVSLPDPVPYAWSDVARVDTIRQLRSMRLPSSERRIRRRTLTRRQPMRCTRSACLPSSQKLLLLLRQETVDPIHGRINLALRSGQHMAAASRNDVGVLIGHRFQVV